MISARTMTVLLIAGATGLGAYITTLKTRPASAPAPADSSATEALLSWLGASESQREELRTHDAGFAAELKQLKADLAAKRAAFAAVLEKGDAPDDQILTGLEAVLAANNALERRIAEYLLSVRDHLTPEQQRKLFGLCAEEARHGRQWRGGRGESGLGPPSGRQGQGRGWRGGRGGGSGQQ